MNFHEYYFITEAAKAKPKDIYLPSTKVNLKARYDYWNKTLFGGKLDDTKIIYKETRGASGSAAFLAERKTGIIYEPESWFINIGKKHKRTQDGWDSIIIHEMVHHFFHLKYLGKKKTEYFKFLGKDGHAEPFVKKCNTISKKVGFTIPLTDEQTGMDTKTPLKNQVRYFVMEYEPGKWAALLYTPSVFASLPAKEMGLKMIDQITSKNRKVGSGLSTDAGLVGVSVKKKVGKKAAWEMITPEVGERLAALGVNM